MIDIKNLKNAIQISKQLNEFISADDLELLAKDGKIPYYLITNPVTSENKYAFYFPEVDAWFQGNWLKKIEVYPNMTFLQVCVNNIKSQVPMELNCIEQLIELPYFGLHIIPGIYFLCKDGKLQYIGQARHVARRVTDHLIEGEKDFNAVFYIPCAPNRLDDLETALIDRLKPPLNKIYKSFKDPGYSKIILNKIFA
jgi:hypothetical protein